MAKKAGKSGKAGAEPKAKPKGGIGKQFLLLSVILTLLFVATPTALVLAVGLAPTLVAAFIDRTSGTYAARCVGACNMAGILPALRDLWVEGHRMATAKMLLNDPFNWLQMYGAAAVGWLLFWGVPMLSVFVEETRRERQVKRLRARQEEWKSEWGRNIAEQ